ncbi:hypothetical protein SUGI_0460310 [Cryptomeria japonica]|nr:hypothetical protein SUGI_0460310 [Cryptomeria japonica]
MLWQIELYWTIVFRISICICLAGFTAAKCDPEICGSMKVSYPFWINNSQCGYPGFKITCRIDNSTGLLTPFFYAFLGNYTDEDRQGQLFKIMEIDYAGILLINSTSLKAHSCSGNTAKFFTLPEDGPFIISKSNKFVVVGCHTFGTYTYREWVEARCVSTCDFQSDPPYCGKAYYGLRVNWGIGLENCSAARPTANYSCSINAGCIDSPSEMGHVCKCLPGYEGNGYYNGTDCTDIDECSDKKLNMCVGAEEGGICHNLAGSYNCSCANTYMGDGFRNGTKCVSPQSKNTLKSGIIGSVSSFLIVSVAACGLFWCLRRRRLKQAKERNFRQNGGLLLQERIASMGGRKGLRIFSETELQIASKNYSTELRKGGFATVYKGVLVDGTPVAIIKPKSISDEFINEIIILSHINHRNSGERRMSWQTRWQIAIETAEAISYMHRQASQPIFHRDIKSSNILLDDTFTPKVADFGLSRLRPSEEMHLSTMAVGTRGYVDPEFVRSNQFTDKGDVYSFGVVLVELLTGLTPLLSIQGSMCALYDHFLSAL